MNLAVSDRVRMPIVNHMPAIRRDLRVFGNSRNNLSGARSIRVDLPKTLLARAIGVVNDPLVVGRDRGVFGIESIICDLTRLTSIRVSNPDLKMTASVGAPQDMTPITSVGWIVIVCGIMRNSLDLAGRYRYLHKIEISPPVG